MDYILESEKIILNKLRQRKSVLITHSIPKIYQDTSTQKYHKGLNQLKLAELEAPEKTEKISSVIKSNKIIKNKTTYLISEHKNKEIQFNFYIENNEKTRNIFNTNKIKIKPFYNLSDINELIDYYFSCALKKEFYCPYLTDNEIIEIINFIQNNPYDFSLIVNTTFKKLLGEK